MLNEREQQTLDATAAQVGHDDPVLAARLACHTLPAWAGRRRCGLPAAAWPPLILAVFCLLLLVLPALLI